jgi:hypothetical protein
MRKRLRIITLSIIIFLITACTATRKRHTEAEAGIISNTEYNSVIEQVKANNITDEGFILKKGRIEIEGKSLNGSYIINAKYNKEGELNASIRGPLGIELLRLLSIKGQVYLVDRIGRTVYTGRTDEVLKKYGLPENIIAIILGDFTGGGIETYSMDGREIMLIEGDMENMDWIVSVCINEGKVCEELYRDRINGNEVKLKYENFKDIEGKKYASEIYMDQGNKKLQIRLRIEDLIYGCDDEISFAMPSYRVKNL